MKGGGGDHPGEKPRKNALLHKSNTFGKNPVDKSCAAEAPTR